MWGKGIEDAILGMFVIGFIISAVVGWGVIEGLIWIFSHITISFL